jgi:dolichol-phosphate mannosyltransferase
LASDIILSFSDRPLKFAIGLGTGISTLSVLVGGWILLRSLIGNYAVQGWSSLIVTIFFSTGVILIILGINGIYLSKIFNEVKRRPLYIIESIFKG